MNPTTPQSNPMLEQLKDIHLPDPVSWWPIAWLNFLDSKLKTAIFLPSLEAFAFIPDNPKITIDTVQLKSACELWIRKVQC